MQNSKVVLQSSLEYGDLFIFHNDFKSGSNRLKSLEKSKIFATDIKDFVKALEPICEYCLLPSPSQTTPAVIFCDVYNRAESWLGRPFAICEGPMQLQYQPFHLLPFIFLLFFI